MIRVFTDASVIIASIISPTGASCELLKRHTYGEIQLIINRYVLLEAKRNLKLKSPNNVGTVDMLVDLLALDIVEVKPETVREVSAYTEMKDAPVVAGAIKGECQYLLTYDKKHLLNKPKIATHSGLIIATPGDLLQSLHEDG